jgi:hypothetical protein
MALFDRSMARFLIFWLVLGVAQLATRAAVSRFYFHVLDLRFEVFFQLIVVPAFQALLVCAALPVRRPVTRRAAWTAAAREPSVAVFLVLDVLVLVLAWALRGHPWFLPATLAAAQALAAGVLLIVFALGRRFSGSERAWLLLAGVAALAYAVDFGVGWIAALPGYVFARKSRFLRSLLLYPPLFFLGVVFLLKVEAIFRSRWPAPAQVLDSAPAFAVATGTVAVLNFYWRPFLVEPWTSVARTGAFLAVASLFASLLLLLRSKPSQPAAGPEAISR